MIGQKNRQIQNLLVKYVLDSYQAPKNHLYLDFMKNSRKKQYLHVYEVEMNINPNSAYRYLELDECWTCRICHLLGSVKWQHCSYQNQGVLFYLNIVSGSLFWCLRILIFVTGHLEVLMCLSHHKILLERKPICIK